MARPANGTSGRVRRTIAAVIALLFVAPACGGEASTRQTPAPADDRTYMTQKFAAPLTINVPEPFAVPPAAETETFLTWVAADPNRVRFLLPAAVYRAGRTVVVEPPVDYLGFFDAETAGRVAISDRSARTVGGRNAEIFTAVTADGDLDGILGCPRPAPKDAGNDCFGLQPGYTFRIAIISVKDGVQPIVAWTPVKDTYRSDQEAVFSRFHTMLDSIAFR